jgi:aldehyde:ferredoxin oxidoreductase
MNRKTIFGCMGQTLRVDLTEKKAWKEELDEATYNKVTVHGVLE